MTLLPYNEVESQIHGKKPDLILGCGFSAGFDKGFSYDGIRIILENSNHKEKETICNLFSHFDTSNIESIMTEISNFDTKQQLKSKFNQISYDGLFDAFIYALVTNHIQLDLTSRNKIRFAAKFISKFHTIFNLNFDLILYYVFLEANKHIQNKSDCFCDGFGKHDDDWLIYKSHYCYNNFIFYLHGSLMLYLSQNGNIFKVKRTHLKLSEIIDKYSKLSHLPYVIASSHAENKIRLLKRSKYGRLCLKSLCSINGPLIIFGTSMSKVDAHIWATLVHNPYIKEMYIGIFDASILPNINITMERINFKRKKYDLLPISYQFFDSKTLNPWIEQT